MVHSIFWIIVLVCWGLFAGVWFLGWIYNLVKGPEVQRRSVSIPLWIIGLILLLLVERSSLLNSISLIRSLPLWAQSLGVALLVPATLFTLWARFTLGTMWSSMPQAKVGHQLRTDGPYQITRHPIYTGMLGMLIGSLLVGGIGYWSAFAVAGVFIVLLKIPMEEKLMIAIFGDEYRQYQQRVPQVIPGLQLLKSSHNPG